MSTDQMIMAMAELNGWTKVKLTRNGWRGIPPAAKDWLGARPGLMPDWHESKDCMQYWLEELSSGEMAIFEKHLLKIPGVGYSWLAEAPDLLEAYLKTKGVWRD